MQSRLWAVALGGFIALGAATSLAAQAPAGATAKCKDDSYSTSKSHRGACKGHGGVADWLAASSDNSKDKSSKTATTKTTTPTETAATGPAPADATAKCKDNSYTSSKSHRGACKGHGGVSEWLADEKSSSTTTSTSKTTKTAPPTASTAAPAPAPGAASTTTTPPTPKTASSTAPSGGDAADATAQCKDGSYSHAHHHRGACSKHGGVQQWLKDVPE
jgi:hypothetical protein